MVIGCNSTLRVELMISGRYGLSLVLGSKTKISVTYQNLSKFKLVGLGGDML